MTDRLVAEFAGQLAAGTVLRCIGRSWEHTRRSGTEPLVETTEALARTQLAAVVPAHPGG